MRVVRLVILGLALLASVASFGPDPMPEPDTCEDPTTEGVTSIEFLRSTGTD